ncbi:NUDIX hydrolase domain-like protein [Mucor mucedo]|uniref:NUDIX hydrolase domain-like protein n=1 Tax=Mucor mucedo TaxID=29922 RepID=UPI0022207E61|nr:NUDIX hydrolase domain-like protein [Mucor mucedo]KAI7896741.1 NUDIX hydrolase domain-like protein [Mucor mucedo]
MSVQKDVLVGVGCFVTYRDTESGKVRLLIGERKGSHGARTFGLPGGHLDMFEDFESCAQREVAEESNLSLPKKDIRFITAINSIMREEQRHYVTIFMCCQIKAEAIQDVRVMEPDKLQGDWQWITREELPKLPLFSPLRQFVEEQDLSFLD